MFGLLIMFLIVGVRGVGSELRASNNIFRSSWWEMHTVNICSRVSLVPHVGHSGEKRGLMRCLETLESFWVKLHRM